LEGLAIQIIHSETRARQLLASCRKIFHRLVREQSEQLPFKIFVPTFGAQKSAKGFCRHKANPGFAGTVACAVPEVAASPPVDRATTFASWRQKNASKILHSKQNFPRWISAECHKQDF
jgi:hypothetical protein